MAMSKALNSFENKVLHFNDDIEFIDILYSRVMNSEPPDQVQKLFEGQNSEKHPNLSRYKVCKANRLMVVRHLKSTMYSSYIKDLYEELTIYLRSIAMEAYQNAAVAPERIIGEHKINMSAVDILSGVRDGSLAQTVINSMFQALENERSTISLIRKTCTKLGIEIDESLIKAAVDYLEIRHKLVHTDGYADEDFRRSHPALRYTSGNYIDLSYQDIVGAREAVSQLISAIDQDALAKDILRPHTSV